jgi:hypothetical protein
MSFFTRCFTKKSHTTSAVESPIDQNDDFEHRKTKEELKQVENRERAYNELHFSSGMDLPIHPKIIHPSNVLDKKLVIGQFGEPKKSQKLVEIVNTAQESVNT